MVSFFWQTRQNGSDVVTVVVDVLSPRQRPQTLNQLPVSSKRRNQNHRKTVTFSNLACGKTSGKIIRTNVSVML
jgi:hypothetical protein